MLYQADKSISTEDLDQILEAVRWTPTAHNMQNFEVVVVNDKSLLKAIGNLKFPISPVFVRENYLQLSFTEEDLKRKKSGIMGTNFPPEMRVPELKEGVQLENNFIGEAISKSQLLLIFTYNPARRAPASEGDFLGILSLGCTIENMWLMANSLDISVHIISSISAEPVEKEVKRILNIPDKLKIAFTARLGYTEPSPFHPIRVRRDIKDFVHYNKYE